MRIELVCVGRLSSEVGPLFAHYAKLLRPYANLQVREVSSTPVSRGEKVVKAEEGARIMERLRSSAHVVVLDRLGRELTSREFSRYLAERKVSGASDFQLVIGGSLGLEQRVISRAELVWSLSPLTFPHQLARCIVAEQLYRSFRIERGEPYHY